MKQFNLEEYLKNPDRKVITRSGKNARIRCTDVKKNLYPVLALVDNGDCEFPTLYTADGEFILGQERDYDLFFAPEKREGWINILNCPNGNFISHTRIFKSKEDAEKVGKNFGSYLTTIKIEWEE